MQEKSTTNEHICDELLKITDHFLETAKVDKGHGIDHIKAVLDHVDRALETKESELNEVQRLAIRCATILHDVDDHKFFESSAACTNAKFLLEQVRPRIEEFLSLCSDSTSFEKFEDLVKQMIDLVSCSSNGNSNDKNLPEFMLYPRIADRLEAIGTIGILRALQYAEYRGRAMYDDETERVYTLEELRTVANPERFRRYLSGIRSLTTVGHFYDKILHIGKSNDFGVHNRYFDEVSAARHKIVEEWVLNFWHSLPEPYPSPRSRLREINSVVK